MNTTRSRLSISCPAVLAVILSLGFFLFVVETAHASYSTQGQFSVNTEGGELIARQDPPSNQLDISDSDTSVGGVGNTASAGYAASITNAALSASASAQNALSVPGNYWSASGSAITGLIDDLRFTVPAGNYPSGVYVEAHVQVEGSVGVSGEGATARHIYEVIFDFDQVLIVTDAPAPPVSRYIELTAELAAPGTTFNSPVTRLRRFGAVANSNAHAPGEVAQTGSSSIAIDVICLLVPPGITWVADSGAFGAPDCSTVDSDGDGVTDDQDNCLLVPNADQRDTDGDNIGNDCDPDVNGPGGVQDCIVNFLDLLIYRQNFFMQGDFDTDNNGDNITNFLDLLVVRNRFFGPPGPSASGCN